MKILFFTHYFPPEVNAPATRTFEHCVRWAEAGHDVTVVTCVPNCPTGTPFAGYRNKPWPQVEHVDGVRVVRVWTYLAANAGTFRRIANYLSYMFSAILAAIRLPRPDVVVATSPQFFCGWAGVLVSRLKRAPFVLEIRDIWPESIEAVGAMRNRWVLKFLERLERWMYLSADQIVTVGKGYRGKVLEKVSPPKPISVITNGVDLDFFKPREPDEEFLREWGLRGKFVCSYIGTIGMAHGLEVVIEAARILKDEGRRDICFAMVGDGASRRQLEEEALVAGVQDMVVFTGRQPKERMPAVLASSNACLIHLRDCKLFGTVLPSKIFETMAMERPIIMGVRGEARNLVMETATGLDMEPDSAKSLVGAVKRLADHPDYAVRAGAAREFIATNYNRDLLARAYLRLLHDVIGDETEELAEDGEPSPVILGPIGPSARDSRHRHRRS